METFHNPKHPQQGRIRAALDRLAELAEIEPVIELKIQQDAQEEAEREADQIRDTLKEDGMSIIEIAQQIQQRKPR